MKIKIFLIVKAMLFLTLFACVPRYIEVEVEKEPPPVPGVRMIPETAVIPFTSLSRIPEFILSISDSWQGRTEGYGFPDYNFSFGFVKNGSLRTFIVSGRSPFQIELNNEKKPEEEQLEILARMRVERPLGKHSLKKLSKSKKYFIYEGEEGVMVIELEIFMILYKGKFIIIETPYRPGENRALIVKANKSQYLHYFKRQGKLFRADFKNKTIEEVKK